MGTSVFLAKIIATAYLSISVGFLLDGDYYKKNLGKMLDSPGMMYLGGIMALIIGFLIVEVHNVWVQDWTVIITILGWLALIKGVVLLAFPSSSISFFKPLMDSKNMGKWMLFPLILGLVLGYYGFVA